MQVRNRLFQRTNSARRTSAQGGFSLVDTLATVAVIGIIMIPLLAWMLLTIERSKDDGQPVDTVSFAQVSRFLVRDVATADQVNVPAAGTVLPSACAALAGPAPTGTGALLIGYRVWFQTTTLDRSGQQIEANYATDEVDGNTRLLRVTCQRSGTPAWTLQGVDVVAERLNNQPVPPSAPASTTTSSSTTTTTTTTVPGSGLPVLLRCDQRTPGDPVDWCGKVVMSLQGSKSQPVTLEAVRRVDPPKLNKAPVRAVITCDPTSCRGFRQSEGTFLISFDGSLSTAPQGIATYEWTFSDPAGGPAPLPDIVPSGPDPVDPGATLGPQGLATSTPLTIACDPLTTPTAWRADLGNGNPGCIYRVTLRVTEQNSPESATTSADIVIENASPRIVVSPNPVEAFRAVPVMYSTEGTVDPDGSTLTYEWIFGDGTTSTLAAPEYVDPADGLTKSGGHIYPCASVPCSYTTVLRVSDSYTTVEQQIPVTVRNAPPRVAIGGTTAITVPNQNVTWTATDPNGIFPHAVDPDGNAARNGPAKPPVENNRWTLSSENDPTFAPVTQSGGETFQYAVPFGTYRLLLEVTDIDGATSRAEVQIKVNTAPIAKARSRKGTGAWTTSPTVFSPRVTSANPVDTSITLSGQDSYDPDATNRPGLPADANARIDSYSWRVWGGPDWTAPPNGVWSACAANLSAAVTAKQACELAGATVENTPSMESWPPGTYRLSLVVVDNNAVPSVCSQANPFAQNCVQSSNSSDGPWWLQVKINRRPVVPALTYSTGNVFGIPEIAPCAAPANFSGDWTFCRATGHVVATNGSVTDADGGVITYSWLVPFGVGSVPTPSPSVTVTPPGSSPLGLPSETLQLTATDSDGAATVVSKRVSLINHPPRSLFGVDATGQALKTWTTDSPQDDPYVTNLITTGGDPDGSVLQRTWRFERPLVGGGSESVQITASRLNAQSQWTCVLPTPTTSIQVSEVLGSFGCANVRIRLADYGTFTVTLTEIDDLGASSSSADTLKVLRKAVPRFRVLTGSCGPDDPSVGTPLSGNLVGVEEDEYYTFPSSNPASPATSASVCFDARESEGGNGGPPGATKWAYPDGTGSNRPLTRAKSFQRCTAWGTPGVELNNCLQYRITLEVQNEAGFPTVRSFRVRFNAPPVAGVVWTGGTDGKVGNTTPTTRFLRLASCVTPAPGCSIRLTADSMTDPENRSYDPDGSPDRRGPAFIGTGRFAWSFPATPGYTVLPTSNGGADFGIDIANSPVVLGDNSALPAPIRLTVTDDEQAQSTQLRLSGRTNLPPVVNSPFTIGASAQTIVADVARPVEAVVAEAADPAQNFNCSGITEGTTGGLWQPLGDSSLGKVRWRFNQGSQPQIVIDGFANLRCEYVATTGGSARRTIVSTPTPLTFLAANGTSVSAVLEVTDSDGDRVVSAAQVLQVRSPDPVPNVNPVLDSSPPTPPSTTCWIRENPTSPQIYSSPKCSVWSGSSNNRFTLDATSSLKFEGSPPYAPSPVDSYSWTLWNSANGGTDVTASSSCSSANGRFSCTLPAQVGSNLTPNVYRARVVVTGPTGRTATGNYYLKQNQPPVINLPTPGSSNITRGVQQSLACSATDPDSPPPTVTWRLLRNGSPLWAQGSGAAPCTFTVPTSVPAGPATLEVRAVDADGGVSTSTLALTIVNSGPVANLTVSYNGTACPALPTACVAPPGATLSLNGSASTDPDGLAANLTYAWTVTGPGGFSQNRTGATPPAVPVGGPGTYTVALTVTDPDGGSASSSRSVRVNDAPTPRIAVDGQIVASQLVVGGPPGPSLLVNLSASASTDDDSPLSYVWSVSGPSLSLAGTSIDLLDVPLLQYGLYTITLTVTDPLGASATITRIIRVNEPPVAGIQITTGGSTCAASTPPGCPVNLPFVAPDTLVATAQVNDPDGVPVSYLWELQSPGSPTFTTVADGPDASVDLASRLAAGGVGQYVVRLTVTDNFDGLSSPVLAYVLNNPLPQLTWPSNDPLPVFRGVTFDIPVQAVDPAPASGPMDFTWRIVRNGVTIVGPVDSTRSNFFESLPAATPLGPATVEVTAVDRFGGTTTASRPLDVRNAIPVVTVTPDRSPLVTAPSATYVFTATASDPDGSPASYEWRIDGTSVTSGVSPDGRVLTRTFSAYGSYLVEVVVTDNDGGEGVGSQVVRLNAAPTASIAAFGGPVVFGPPGIQLDGSGSSDDQPIPAENFFWEVTSGPDVPDSVTIDTESPGTPDRPFLVFDRVGTYNVQLVVVDADGVQSDVATLAVVVVP